MHCLEIQNQIARSSSFSKLSRSVQNHLEHCVECQGFYPTRPALRDLLFQALPEMEPDRRLLAAVRQKVDQAMDKPAWSLFKLDFSSLSFAMGVAALIAVLGLPLLWMGSKDPYPTRSTQEVASAAQRVQVRSGLTASPWNSTDASLLVTDSLASLHREYRPQVRSGAVVHVIYPFESKKKKQRPAVVHY